MNVARAPIWVIQTSFVGDCILSLPFLFELLRRSEAPIVIVTQPGIQRALFELALERGLKEFAPRISIATLQKRGSEKTFWGLRRWVRAQCQAFGDPDTVYCLQRSFRSGLLSVLSGAKNRIGFSSGAATFFYTRAVPRSWEQGVHEIEKNLDLLRASIEGSLVPAWRGNEKPSLLASSSRPQRDPSRAAMALGSPWPTKRWPIDQSAELCREWSAEGVDVLLLGDPAARPLAAELKNLAPSLLVHDHVGTTTMKEWVDLMDSASVLVSGDSASVHVASDLGVPVIALFGPTVPDFGFTPWRSHSRVLQHPDLSCRPCSIHGPMECPLGHHKCMKSIGAEQVLRATKAHLLMDPRTKKL